MRATKTLRTTALSLAATSVSALALLGGAGAASAETPPFEPGPVIELPDTEPQPDPGPQLPELEIALPDEEPGPDPLPDPDLPLTNPEDEQDPEPIDPDLPLTNPEPTDDPDPIDPDLPLTNPELPDEPTDHPEGEPAEDSEETEVAGTQQDRDALPRTGAGLVGIAGLGGGLTALGAALRRFARR